MATNIDDIGTGETHTNLASWEAATDIALAGDIYRAEFVEDKIYAETSGTVLVGATGQSATAYRAIAAAAGNEYDPAADTGAVYANDTTTSEVIYVREDFTRVEFIGINQNGTGGNISLRFRTVDDVLVTGCTVFNGTGGVAYSHAVDCNDNIITSCMAIGASITSDGVEIGFGQLIHSGDNPGTIYNNCLCYGIQGDGYPFSPSGTGFLEDNGSTTAHYTNCVSDNCTADWLSDEVSEWNTSTGNNNADGDATAPFTAPVNSIVDTDAWIDPANEDFRLKTVSSDLFEAGTTNAVSTIINGTDHGDATGSYNIGPYDGIFPPIILRRRIEGN